MIIIDLTQKIINKVFAFYAQATGLDNSSLPGLDQVKPALESETRRFVFQSPKSKALPVELWFSEDSNRNIVFTFAIPADLTKAETEKAEEAKKFFDKQLQAYLVDYYI